MLTTLEQEELRARFNPDGSLLRQHQLRMLDMLKYIDAVCKKHDIKYWLCSGTLLGAVRHGGFIPWDDDADIEMLREDYKKFVRVMEKEPQTNYVLQTHETDSGYFYPYAKLRDLHSYLNEKNPFDSFKFRGVYIDIFIMEHSSSYVISRISASIFGRFLPLFIKRNVCSSILYFLVFKIIFGFFRLITYIYHGGQLRHTFGTYFFKARQEEDIFPLKMQKFEDSFFYVPHNSDAYLKKIYGNYLNLPELSKIKKHVLDLELY